MFLGLCGLFGGFLLALKKPCFRCKDYTHIIPTPPNTGSNGRFFHRLACLAGYNLGIIFAAVPSPAPDFETKEDAPATGAGVSG